MQGERKREGGEREKEREREREREGGGEREREREREREKREKEREIDREAERTCYVYHHYVLRKYTRLMAFNILIIVDIKFPPITKDQNLINPYFQSSLASVLN